MLLSIAFASFAVIPGSLASPAGRQDAPREVLPQRVLYAGSPDCERSRQFMALLGEHFAAVEFTDYSGFTGAAADGFDVVVLDADVRPTERSIGLPRRPELADDYDRATVLIGAGGVIVAERFESKLDWL
ncbi:hypothetical protein [Planctomycetes bacterium Pla163]